MSAVAAVNVTSEPLAQELEEAFREHSRLVYRTAYSVTGSAQDAEDVVQTLFLHLLRRGFPPDFQSNPKAYLYRAAVNVSLNAVKSRQRHARNAEATRVEPAVESRFGVHTPNPEEELRERLVNAMAQLNPRAVEMLILRYEHDCSEADIGRLLGTSRGVVAVTLHRARARLEKLLRKSREEP
jgi:RNA polymerase sigma-70 factor (ECF subfamily)